MWQFLKNIFMSDYGKHEYHNDDYCPECLYKDPTVPTDLAINIG